MSDVVDVLRQNSDAILPERTTEEQTHSSTVAEKKSDNTRDEATQLQYNKGNTDQPLYSIQCECSSFFLLKNLLVGYYFWNICDAGVMSNAVSYRKVYALPLYESFSCKKNLRRAFFIIQFLQRLA